MNGTSVNVCCDDGAACGAIGHPLACFDGAHRARKVTPDRKGRTRWQMRLATKLETRRLFRRAAAHVVHEHGNLRLGVYIRLRLDANCAQLK